MKSTYVAFLRGINVGGNTLVSMEALKEALASLGFANIRTVLASGNVVFAAAATEPTILAAKIEQHLRKTLGFEIAVLVRSMEQIKTLVASNPFSKTKVTPQTRLHVTFLPPNAPDGLKISQRLKDPCGFEIHRMSEGEVCSVVELSPRGGTPELMKLLEKNFGKRITTRTWNTVARIERAEP